MVPFVFFCNVMSSHPRTQADYHLNSIMHWLRDLNTLDRPQEEWANRGASWLQRIHQEPLSLTLFNRYIAQDRIDPFSVRDALHHQDVRYDEHGPNTLYRAPMWELWDAVVANAGLYGPWTYGESTHRERWFMVAMETLPWGQKDMSLLMTNAWALMREHSWAWDVAMHALVWESANPDAWPNQNKERMASMLALPGEPGKYTVAALIYQMLALDSSNPQSTEHRCPAWAAVKTRFSDSVNTIQKVLDLDTLSHGAQPWHQREERLGIMAMHALKSDKPMELSITHLPMDASN